jgi:hypothetical protein
MIIRMLLAFLATSVITQFASAQTLSIQGVLRNPSGTTVEDGTYSMIFRIYDEEVGGTSLWEETQSSIYIKHGVYIVELGSVTSMSGLPFNTQYYIGISVEGGQELEPRMKLANFPTTMAVLGVDNSFPSSGNVGVGTTAPDAGLHIITQNAADDLLKIESSSGNARSVRVDVDGNLVISEGGAIQFASDGTALSSANFGGSATAVVSPGDATVHADVQSGGIGNINLKIADVTKVTVLNNGRVGIGTTAPGIGLAVGDDDTGIDWESEGKLHLVANGQTAMSIDGQKVVMDSMLVGDDAGLRDVNVANTIGFFGQQNASKVTLQLGGVEGGSVSGTPGRVGINIADPEDAFHVNGNMIASAINIGSARGSLLDVTLGDGDTGIDWESDGQFSLKANGSALMRVTPTELQTANVYLGGDVRIGNDVGFRDIDEANTLGFFGQVDAGRATLRLGLDGGHVSGMSNRIGINVVDPEDTFHINGNMIADRINIGGARGSHLMITVGDSDTGINQGGDGILDFHTNGIHRMRLDGAGGGNLARYDGDSNWDFASDRRLKENIRNETDILERVMHLDVVNYNFIDNPTKAREMGLIAQDVEEYFPSIVSEYADVNHDFDVKMLGYSHFGVIAVGAVKELKQEKDGEVAQLRERLESLEAANTSLREENSTIRAELRALSRVIDRVNGQVEELIAGRSQGDGVELGLESRAEGDAVSVEADLREAGPEVSLRD